MDDAARFFFDIQDDDGMTRDRTGLELPCLDDAIAEACRALREIGRGAGEPDDAKLAIVVRDRTGWCATIERQRVTTQ